MNIVIVFITAVIVVGFKIILDNTRFNKENKDNKNITLTRKLYRLDIKIYKAKKNNDLKKVKFLENKNEELKLFYNEKEIKKDDFKNPIDFND